MSWLVYLLLTVLYIGAMINTIYTITSIDQKSANGNLIWLSNVISAIIYSLLFIVLLLMMYYSTPTNVEKRFFENLLKDRSGKKAKDLDTELKILANNPDNPVQQQIVAEAARAASMPDREVVSFDKGDVIRANPKVYLTPQELYDLYPDYCPDNFKKGKFCRNIYEEGLNTGVNTCDVKMSEPNIVQKLKEFLEKYDTRKSY